MSAVNPKELVFVAAKRTPFGAFLGGLASLSATDLAVAASEAALKAAGVDPAAIDAVFFGNVIGSSRDAIYLARHVGLRTGVPVDRPALTVNRLCGSGFEAVAQGAASILAGESEVTLVGGTESMSQVPYVLRGARAGLRMGHGELEDQLMASLEDSYVKLPMALTAENLAVQYKISRAEADAFALESQRRAVAAWDAGVYADEVAPVKLTSRKGETLFARDETPRPDASPEGLAKLKPVFKVDGLVTAGNASGITDGAAALVLTTAARAAREGWKVLGKLRAWAARGCDPKIMGIGPVPATQEAMARYTRATGKRLTVQDFRLVEVNEAFAPQYLAVEKELGLDRTRTNIHGGAIAIGHPLAASGARLVAHLLYALPRAGGGIGLASACIGGGQGMSVIIEV